MAMTRDLQTTKEDNHYHRAGGLTHGTAGRERLGGRQVPLAPAVLLQQLQNFFIPSLAGCKMDTMTLVSQDKCQQRVLTLQIPLPTLLLAPTRPRCLST